MATINYINPPIPYTLEVKPMLTPLELKFEKNGDDNTINGVTGTIFTDIEKDDTSPVSLTYGGYKKIESVAPVFKDCENLDINNVTNNIISQIKKDGILKEFNGTPITVDDIIWDTDHIVIKIASPTDINNGDRVYIDGATEKLPDGYYVINGKTDDGTTVSLSINYFINSTNPYAYNGKINFYSIYWNEQFTTPIGLLDPIPDPPPYPLINQFTQSNNTFTFNLNLVNILPKENDFIVIQKVNEDHINYIPQSTVDDIDSFPYYYDSETYYFKIISVPSIDSTNETITITVDKDISINTSATNKYSFVLLNRNDDVTNLYDKDIWKTFVIHREQLLGDAYDTTSNNKLLKGRSNFLNYLTADRLSELNLFFDNIISDDKYNNTPIIIITHEDSRDDDVNNIKEFLKDVEIKLPNLMLNNENINPSLVMGTTNYNENIGNYTSLIGRDSNNIYGYVLEDYRIIIITDPELVMSMSYISNRNITLSTPITSNENLSMIPTYSHPLIIESIDNLSTVVTITTTENHNLSDKSQVIIKNASGVDTSIINPFSSINDTIFYVKSIGNKMFELYTNILLTSPLVLTGSYTGGGICHSTRLEYEFFYTYKIKGSNNYEETLPYAKIVPFNFINFANGMIENEDPSGGTPILTDLKFSIPPIQWLLDSATSSVFGFEWESIDIIVGKFKQIIIDNDYNHIDKVEDVRIVKTITKASLSDPLSTTQLNVSVNIAEYYNSTDNYDFINIQKLYNNPPITEISDMVNKLNNYPIIIKYKELRKQYTLSLKALIKASEFNFTTNKTFDATNILMKDKFISEIAFYIDGEDKPIIAASFLPPIKKSNRTDIALTMKIDF